ncbi:MAG: helix-turn-helix domain-containing protein [Pseudomonadota bacterium]
MSYQRYRTNKFFRNEIVTIDIQETAKSPSWDRHSIKAAIARKGETLAGLAKQYGLAEGGLSVALNTSFPAAERAISDYLQVPLHELWPTRYAAPDFDVSKNTTARVGCLSPDENEADKLILPPGEKAA